MTARRTILSSLATLLLWLVLMRLVGRIVFTPGMTDALVRTADTFGIHGLEAVENAFYLVAALATLLLSIAIVWIVGGIVRRRSNARRGNPA